MRLSDFLNDVGRPAAFYPGLARALGDIKEAIFICQMSYWKEKGGDPDGWIYKTSEELEKETALSYKEQTNVRKGLVEKGLLEERYSRTEHLMYFRVNWTALNDLWEEHLTNGHMPKGQVASDQREGGTLPKVSSLKGTTYITQETTQTRAGNSFQDINAIPFCDYPENLREMAFEVCKLYFLDAPEKPKRGKAGQYAFWVLSLTDLVSAAGEQGVLALREQRADFEAYMEKHSGIAPFTVAGPQSLINAVRGKAAQMRDPKFSKPMERPEFKRLPPEEPKTYVPNPLKKPAILTNRARATAIGPDG